MIKIRNTRVPSKSHKILLAVILIIAVIIPQTGCGDKEPVSKSEFCLDTSCEITIYDMEDMTDAKANEILELTYDEIQKYENLLSKTIEGSDVYRINSESGDAAEVSDDTIDVISKGLLMGKLSQGAFDITVGALTDLWDFKSEDPQVPEDAAIKKALETVGFSNVSVKDNKVKLSDTDTKLDLGGVAKGYIADRIKDYLEEEGVRHAMINLGGNVLAMGSKLDGSDYNIGIQEPFDETGEPITSVKISDKSVVTSGIYQRYFKADGKIYHHILDPNTGYPCENNLYSVTILTDSSLTADALSTTCFLLGYDRGMKLINQLDNVDAVFITNDNQIHYSKNFQNNQ